MKSIISVLLLSLSLGMTAQAAPRTIGCEVVGTAQRHYKVAVVQYHNRDKKVLSVWMSPSKDAHVEEQMFVDGCLRSTAGQYSCTNPMYDVKVLVRFDGRNLSIKSNGSVSKYICEDER